MKIKIFVCIFVMCIISCSTKKKILNCNLYPSKGYFPVDLFDAVEYLNCKWSEKDKRKIAYLTEDKVIGMYHFGIGMGIRNNWELWQGENDLVKFFNSHGIFHPDDMSSIILISFHRKLNNKEIDFESQVQYYLDYWAPIEEFERKETKRVLEAYEKYQLGDTITLYMEIFDFGQGDVASVRIGANYEWTFNPEKDLEFKGKIVQKEMLQDSTNVTLSIQVFEINKVGLVKTIWQDVKLGDTTKVELRYLKYE